MRRFHSLEVAEIIDETPDARRVRFAVPEDLRDLFRYREGQHLTLRKEIGGEELRRCYSICSAVDEAELSVVVRHVPGGRFSGYVAERLAVGETIDVLPPLGHFNLPPAGDGAEHYVAFAAGAGITPVMSILKTALGSRPDSRFTLFYGNRTAESTIFRDELSDLKNRHMERFAFYHFLSRQELEIPFFRGRLDGDKVTTILDTLLRDVAVDAFFVCGPGGMIDEVTAALAAKGVDAARIHSERFTNEGQPTAVSARAAERVQSHATAGRIRAILDGNAHEVGYDPAKGSVLAALEAAGLDVPYSCKGGVCTTCRAKVLEGSAEMAVNYGLEPAEVEAGFILTCQAVPTSDRLVISYDE